jgi:minor extracellular serine protease Vpr
VGAVALAAAALVLAGTVRGAGDPLTRTAAQAWQAVFGERAQPAAQGEERVLVVLAAPSLADRMAVLEREARPREQRRWTAEAEGAQKLLLAGLRERGIRVARDRVFTRTFNGFSAVVTARALAELERATGVAGVYPVRTVYPASVTASLRPDAAGREPETRVSLRGFDGSGVRVALLDTGVDRRHPYVRGRVLRGFDLVDGDRNVAAEAKPDEPGALEIHGTQMAGLVVGRDGPGGVSGIAPGAKVLPIRVLGWEQVDDGGYAVLGRGDILLAGLERAVDPNEDGNVADGVSIALAPVSEPYAAFVDSPEARAVAGAARLGTLVVAPAGNDGRSGTRFGALAAPGSAPDALGVGAIDDRASSRRADATLSAGDDELLAEPLRVLGAVGPEAAIGLDVTALTGPTLANPARGQDADADGTQLADFFDTDGVSLVAGRAVLLPAGGGTLARKARNAAAAGAAAVLVRGIDLPAGALDSDESAAIPVLALPAEAGLAALEALNEDETVTLSLEAAASVSNPARMEPAAFSSGGLAFDGRVKPDVVAPGLGLTTSDAGNGASYATATGTSAAAAVTAGAAALVAQARPDLEGADLKSVLVGTAGQLARNGDAFAVTAQGAGLVDPARAADAELAVGPATLAFGRAEGRNWTAIRVLTVRNVSDRELQVGFGVVREGDAARSLTFSAAPAGLRLGPGEVADVQFQVSAKGNAPDGARGALVVGAEGAQPMRVPWAIAARAAGRDPLVDDVRLSNQEFAPSNVAPAVLAFRAGRVDSSPEGDAIEPVGLLELELWTADGERLGVLARMRDVLPGRYAFGLTGRGPEGRVLPEGTYVARLRAHPVDGEDGEKPSTAQAVFRITE